MRRAPACLFALTLPALVVALPVLSRPVPRPHAVRPVVQEMAVRGVDAGAARAQHEPGLGASGPARTRAVVLTPPRITRSFALLGVTWAEDRALGELDVSVRTRAAGRWSGWEAVDADDDHGPDLGTGDLAGHRGGTSPLWVGRADGVQVRVGVVSGAAPRDVRVSLVDPGRSDADSALGSATPLGGAGASAAASTGRPTIITRAQWGADESIRRGHPDYATTVKMGFVHHTVSTNSYSWAQAAGLVRAVYAFHVRSRGWSDIGYNFLVDKFGRIYEGRAGGVDKPVIGSHTSGFNTGTFGVSLLGTYTSVVPSAAQLTGLQRILAWRLQAYHRNPTGTTVLTSAGGTRYAKGAVVRLNTISGHRDGGQTACPGTQTYLRLPTIRTRVRALMGTNLLDPVVGGHSPLYLDGSRATVRAGGLTKLSWRWRITSIETGVLVRSISSPAPVTSVSASWDLRNAAGVLVPPGRYRTVLEAWGSTGNRSVPFVSEVQVRSPLSSGEVVQGPDGVLRVLTGPFAERPTRALGTVLHGPGSVLPVRPDQYASFGVAPARIPDGAYFRTTSGAAYVVTGGVRRHVDATTATALKMPTAPATMPDALWQQLPAGARLTATTRHPDGMLVTDTRSVWRLEQGRRRPLTSAAAAATWRKVRPTVPALAGDLALPLAAELGPAEGTLLRLPDAGSAVVSGGTLRPFASAPVAATLGYQPSTAPLATARDIAALPAGDVITLTSRHPSGALLRTPTVTWQLDGDRRRVMHPALLALDVRTPLAAMPGDLALPVAAMSAPEGFAAVGADGVVRVVVSGRLVAVTSEQAAALGYAAATLPLVEASAFGVPIGASLFTDAAHPDGSLVSAPDGVWLLEGGSRRLLTPAVLATYRGRVVVAAAVEDLALPVAAPAPPPHAARVISDGGQRWLVDQGRRRLVRPLVATRLGLDALTWTLVPLADLAGAPVTSALP